MASSWHIPDTSTSDPPSPDEALHVIFLQRLPKDTRKHIVDSLFRVQAHWAAEYDPSGVMSTPRQMRVVPWIRDSWPSSETILEILSAERDKYKSYILVDSLWEASSFIAAHWTTDDDGKPRLDAVRVSMSIANVLLTLIDNESIDLYEEGPVEGREGVDQPSYEPPSFLPSDLKLDRSKLELICLRELSKDQIEALKTEILGNSGEVRTVPSVTITNWHGPLPSRSELRQLYEQMNANSKPRDRNSLAWFVDDILEGNDHSPRIIALAPQPRPEIALDVSQLRVSLFPIQAGAILPLFNNCIESDACFEKVDEHCDKDEREDIVTLRNPLDFGDGSDSFCPVFYLCPFTMDQERAIRKALNDEDEDYKDDVGKNYVYYGCLFPPDSGTHTVQDLCDLFQKCDPFSPTFDPSYSGMRFKNYPGTFVAVDLKCLDAESPQVAMASVEYDWPEYPEDGTSHYAGWRYGTNKPGMAWTSYVNLWIANMNSDELFEDDKMLYLHDLKEHEEQRRIEEEEGL